MVFSLHWFCKSLPLFGGKTYLKKVCNLWLFCWQNPAWVPWYSKAQYRPSPRWHLSFFNQLMVHGMVGMKLVEIVGGNLTLSFHIRAEFWYPKLYHLNSVWGVFPNSSSWAFEWKWDRGKLQHLQPKITVPWVPCWKSNCIVYNNLVENSWIKWPLWKVKRPPAGGKKVANWITW